MKSKIYTDLEIKSLEKSPFVLEVRNKRFISYDPLFKLWTILQRKKYPEKTSRELFEYAGFNTKLMNPKLPQTRIKSWENLFYRYGVEYFISNKTYALLLESFNGEVVVSKNETQSTIYRLKIYKELKDLLLEEKSHEERCSSSDKN